MRGRPAAGATGEGRRLPPVSGLCIASMACVITGGIFMASYLPRPAPAGPAAGLLATSGALLAAAALSLARAPGFAWGRFLQVAGWSLLGYVVIAGILEYVFVLDHTRGATLLTLTLMLLVYALDIPLLWGFSVARYERSPSS